LAHHRVYVDREAAMRFLEPLETAIQRYGLGTLGEIFDGDAPFAPKGCIAQAWSVGEVLRAWLELAREPNLAGDRSKTPKKSAAPV
jgi:glycogen debranching enzyme